jgi:hypothetical protein
MWQVARRWDQTLCLERWIRLDGVLSQIPPSDYLTCRHLANGNYPPVHKRLSSLVNTDHSSIHSIKINAELWSR